MIFKVLADVIESVHLMLSIPTVDEIESDVMPDYSIPSNRNSRTQVGSRDSFGNARSQRIHFSQSRVVIGGRLESSDN